MARRSQYGFSSSQRQEDADVVREAMFKELKDELR